MLDREKEGAQTSPSFFHEDPRKRKVILVSRMLSPDEAAALLGVPPETFFRWVRQGKILLKERDGRMGIPYRELEQWARERHIHLEPRGGGRAPGEKREEGNLLEACRRGGVFFGVKASGVEDFLARAVELAPLPEGVDRENLLDRLLQRELMASTALGEGVAVPHPRKPLAELETPVVSTFFLAEPLDFHALDGKPVRVVFLMLGSSTREHLKLLSQLAFFLKNPEARAALERCGNEEEFFGILESFSGGRA